MLYQIEAEGSNFNYDNAGSYKYINRNSLIYDNDLLDFIPPNKMLTICRPVLTIYYLEEKFVLNYLYWFENISLKDIDNRVEENIYSDRDFEFSIKTQFVKKLRCFSCGTEYPGALVVPTDLIYPPNFNLSDIKRNLFKEKNSNIICPKCKNNFTFLVAYLFR